MTPEALQQIIDSSPLSQTTKDFFSHKVKREGATAANIGALKELLIAVQYQAASRLGLNDKPQIQELKKKLDDNLKQASDKFNQELKDINARTKRISQDIQADLKTLEDLVVKSAQDEAWYASWETKVWTQN